MDENRVAIAELRAEIAKLRRLLLDEPRLHRKDVAYRYGISLCTLHRWLKDGRLPRPIHPPGPMWRRCDLERHERRQARRAVRSQGHRAYKSKGESVRCTP
jgi:hypothetical protein